MSQCAQYRLAFSRQKELHKALELSAPLQSGAGVCAGTAGSVLFQSHVCLSHASKEKAICI